MAAKDSGNGWRNLAPEPRERTNFRTKKRPQLGPRKEPPFRLSRILLHNYDRNVTSITPAHMWGTLFLLAFANAVASAQTWLHTIFQIFVGRQFAHQRFADLRESIRKKNINFWSTWPDSRESRLLSDSHWNSRDSRLILAAVPPYTSTKTKLSLRVILGAFLPQR